MHKLTTFGVIKLYMEISTSANKPVKDAHLQQQKRSLHQISINLEQLKK